MRWRIIRHGANGNHNDNRYFMDGGKMTLSTHKYIGRYQGSSWWYRERDKEIVEMKKSKYPVEDIAFRFNIMPGTVREILRMRGAEK